MKNFLFCITFYCLVLSSNSFAQWQTITVPVSGQDVFGISFINDTSAYVSVDHDLLYTQNDFSTFTTLPWSTYLLGQSVPVIKEDLHEIRFTDISHGLLTGGFNTFNDYMVLQTDNGGVSWDIIYTSNSGPIFRYISAMDFNNGIGLGAGGNGRIIRSTNDGDTWINVSSNTTENLVEVQFINSNNAIAVGENALLRSSDAGASWTSDAGFSSIFLYGLAVSNGGNNVYASAYDKFFYSLNGGTSFDTINLPFNKVNCLVATGTDTVFAGTEAGIYLSKDHGLHWHQFQSTQSYYINRLVIQGSMLYALCNDGYILRNGLSSLAPEPIAAFTSAMNESCNQTTVTINSNSDPSYSYSWYVNGILQSTSNTGFNFTRSNSTTDSVSVIVDNGISTDTASSIVSVHVREYAILSPVPDQSGCYGQTFTVTIQTNPGHTYTSSLNNSAFTSFSQYLDTMTVNSTLVIKANTADNCPVYDTSYYTISAQIIENFLPTIPSGMIGNWRLAGVEAPNDTIVYAVDESNDFFKSTDRATTWTASTLPNTITRYDVMDFVNDTLGYIPHGDYKTVNGGVSWTHMNAFNSHPCAEAITNFLNVDTGIFAQEPSNFNYWDWELFITYNGGTTITQLHYFDSLVFNVFDIEMLDVNTIIACGSKGQISSAPVLMKTTDGGMSWNYLITPATQGITAMSILSEDTIFVMEANDYVHRTYDGGQTWQTFYLGYNNCGCEGRIKMINAQVGYLTRGKGEVYKTENGGDCWTQVAMLTDNAISRIAVSPSGSDVYISGHNLYHYHTGKNLVVSIDPGYCADSPIYTHNASSGYTSYAWYLDGQPYSSQRDTVFFFSSAGNHIITMYADSAGTGIDSVQYAISVQPSIGSVGSITGPISACSSTGGFVTYNYTVGTNANVSTFQWWTDSPNRMTTDLSTEIDSSVDIHLVNNTTSSSYIHLYAVGISAAGCFTNDTAIYVMHQVHAAPATPILYATSVYCYNIPENSFNSPVPFDSVLVSVNPDPLADFYQFQLQQTTDTFAYESIYTGCPDLIMLDASASNSCGISSPPGLLPVSVFYVPTQVTHTPDTAVEFGTGVQFYFHPYSNPDLLACSPLDIWWTLPDGSTQQTNDEYFDIFNFFINDTGYYTPYCVMGCDTVFGSFHVGDNGWVGIYPSTKDGFYFTAYQNEEIIQTKYQLLNSNAEIILSDVTGRVLKELKLVAGTTSTEINVSDVVPGIYQLQFISGEKRKTVKLVID